MARTSSSSSSLPRPVLLSSVGLLRRHIPLSTVTAVLAAHGKQGERDRLLPAPFLVYLIVALSLYMPYALREVLLRDRGVARAGLVRGAAFGGG